MYSSNSLVWSFSTYHKSAVVNLETPRVKIWKNLYLWSYLLNIILENNVTKEETVHRNMSAFWKKVYNIKVMYCYISLLEILKSHKNCIPRWFPTKEVTHIPARKRVKTREVSYCITIIPITHCPIGSWPII